MIDCARRRPAAFDESSFATLEVVDHTAVDWARVSRTTYLIHHLLRYTYPGPITRLSHRLVVVPPGRFGAQRRVVYRIEVTGVPARVAERTDRFGNVVIEVRADRVDKGIAFETWAVVERCACCDPPHLTVRRAEALELSSPSRLTRPDDHLRAAAAELRAAGPGGIAFAERVADWTHRTLTYEFGTTTVSTTAAEALADGRGVCQDYAHVMLAVCRAGGLPARYVSGHLLGEGGTHAWVEVLVPDRVSPGSLIAVGLDPTNARRVGSEHVAVAVGRDYGDVAPTSGTFIAPHVGYLQATKRTGVTSVEYANAPVAS
jgi:transglutaminase-like putative cysteine protease